VSRPAHFGRALDRRSVKEGSRPVHTEAGISPPAASQLPSKKKRGNEHVQRMRGVLQHMQALLCTSPKQTVLSVGCGVHATLFVLDALYWTCWLHHQAGRIIGNAMIHARLSLLVVLHLICWVHHPRGTTIDKHCITLSNLEC
jgi:hypothetical protein